MSVRRATVISVFLAAVILLAGLPAWAQDPPVAPGSSDTLMPESGIETSGGRIYIDITPDREKVYIAVPDFLPVQGGTGGPKDLVSELPGILQENMEMTGMFNPVDKRSFLEANVRAGLTGEAPVNYQEWLAIGAQFLIKGAFAVSGGKLTVELRLFNVAEGRMQYGKRYTWGREDGRRIVNCFTNDVLKELTGERGVFGTKIVFVAGGGSNKVVVMTEFGSDVVKGVSSGGTCFMPAFSSSGSVAYVSREGTAYKLKVGPEVIYSGDLVVSPAFTPGGALLAGLSGASATNIYRFPGPGSKPVQVTNDFGINMEPSVAPDGSQMVFVSDRAGGAQLYVGSVSGGPARRLLTFRGNTNEPSWSPRGDRIAFTGNANDIYTVNPDGSDLQQLTFGTGRNMHPSWSPDGRLIVFSSTRLGKSQLFVMAANGDRQRPILPDYKGSQNTPVWSPSPDDGCQ